MIGREQMKKVRIVFLSKKKQEVVAELHDLGIMDFRKSKLELSDDQPQEHFAELSDLLIKYEGAIRLLPDWHIELASHHGTQLGKVLEAAGKDKVLDEIYSLDAQRKEIEDEQKYIEYASHIAKAFSGMIINFSRLSSERVDFRGFETDADSLAAIEQAIGKGKVQAQVRSYEKDKKAVFIIAYAKEETFKVDDIIKASPRLREVDLCAKYVAGTPKELLVKTQELASSSKQKTSQINATLAQISRDHAMRMLDMLIMIHTELERANASMMFKKTQKTSIIEGWVPSKRLGELKTKLDSVAGGAVYIEELKEDGESAPMQSNRPKFMKSFDYMMEFFSVPRSDEMDPTLVFFLTFPIFYGLMVTDVGYGVLSFLLSTLIIRKTDPRGLVWNAAQIWRISSISAIFFGFITNQYFGLALNQYFLPFSGIDWIKNVTFFVLVSVLFGLGQVIIGLTIGFINKFKKREMKHAISKLTSISMLAFGTLFVGGAFFNVISPQLTETTGIVAAISLLATLILSGSEAIEVTSLIAHPLSFLRIMGFGLASVIIAFLIDKAFTPSLSQGPILFVLYLAIFLILHTLNMIVSIFEGIIQGMRLNFLEFFTKFYTGGGQKFKPFGKDEIHTKKGVIVWQ